MAKLTGQSIASSYDQVVIVDDADGINATLQPLESADTGGGVSALKIATNKVEVIPSAADDAKAFEISKADNTAIITADSSAETVDIAGHDASAKGLKLGGTLVTATAAELNVLDADTANGSNNITATSSVLMKNGSTTEKKDVDDLAAYMYNHFCRIGTVSLWNASSAFNMSNTSGVDLSNTDAPFNTDDFNDSFFDLKLVVHITANSATQVNFQLQYDNASSNGNVAIAESGWTYTAMSGGGAVYESPVTAVSLAAGTPYRFKMHGWVSNGSVEFNNAYFWARPKT